MSSAKCRLSPSRSRVRVAKAVHRGDPLRPCFFDHQCTKYSWHEPGTARLVRDRGLSLTCFGGQRRGSPRCAFRALHQCIFTNASRVAEHSRDGQEPLQPNTNGPADAVKRDGRRSLHPGARPRCMPPPPPSFFFASLFPSPSPIPSTLLAPCPHEIRHKARCPQGAPCADPISKSEPERAVCAGSLPRFGSRAKLGGAALMVLW